MLSRETIFKHLQRQGPLLALLLLIGLATVLDRGGSFLTWPNFSNILRQNSVVGIIALGMTFVIILGGIDLSVGSMVAFIGGAGLMALSAAAAVGEGGAIAANAGVWWPIVAGVGAMLIGGTLLGALNGLIITKGRITPFIATLGGMAMFRSLALVFKDGGEYRSNVPQWANLFSPKIGEDSLRMFPVFIFLGLALILHVILKHTRYGTAVHAIGDNDKAALYSGIKIDRVKIITYSLCGLLCGIAAVLISSRMNSISSAQTGLMYELDAIAAVVVGGASMRGGSGRIWGTIIGVMILGVVNNMLNMISSSDTLKTLGLENINIAHLQGLVKGVIIIAAVLVQRQKE